MSNLVFPALRMSPQTERSSSYRTTIHESLSGLEQRTSWRSRPRRRISVHCPRLREDVAAPAPFQDHSEVGVIWHFWDTHRGEFDSFLFNDRDEHGATVQRRVRFDGEPRLTRLFGGGEPGKATWAADFDLLEVLT